MSDGSGRLIAVEGCIGVGKTTWAKALAKARKAKLVLENFDENPFLPAFYENPRGNALETELHFLLVHYHQLKEVRFQNTPETLTDFTFLKDRIYAKVNLDGAMENDVFNRLYDYLGTRLRPADMVIYLRGSNQLILNRIRARNRAIEMKTEMAYFTKLNKAYEEFFKQYRGALHVVDAESMDCLKQPEVVSEVSNEIGALLEVPGRS